MFQAVLLEEFRLDFIDEFDAWLEWRLDLESAAFGREIDRDVTSEMRAAMAVTERTLRANFDANLDRSFSVAANSIAEALGGRPPRGRRFQFGTGALARILRRFFRRREEEGGPEDPGEDRPVEGFTRLATLRTGRRRLFRIRLAPYVRLLIVTSQHAWRIQFWEQAALSVGGDLVVIDNHPPKVRRLSGGRLEVCEVWRGRTISLTGLTRGVPTLQDAKDAGMFHPNCTHGIKPLSSTLAREREKNRALAT